jgi:hypothetical protein
MDFVALLLMGVGLVVLLLGFWWGAKTTRTQQADPPKALALMRGFRIAVIGLCLSAYGTGWWWRIDWLMTVAIVVCLEEIAESSFYIAALKRTPT